MLLVERRGVAPAAASSVSFVGDRAAILKAAPPFAALMLLAWVALIVATSSAQWGDHFEQFAWAHSFELGYHKHPPLPTWLLAATIEAFGPSVFWAFSLATACMAGTLFFTYSSARLLFGDATATLALLLTGLLHAFSARASLFNHNSVMLLTVSAASWCVLKALAADREAMRWWLAAGAAAGLAVLAKYQALVPLAGLVVAAGLGGDLAARSARRGLFGAAVTMALVCSPHVYWLLQGNTTTIDYAAQHGRDWPWSDRIWNVAGFVAQQLRYLLAPLFFMGITALLPGARPPPERRDLRRRRAWLFGLVGFPLAVTVLTGPVIGVQLQNHWGYQALQFVSLWLAWRLRPLAPAAGWSWVAAAFAVHCAFLGIAFSAAGDSLATGKKRIDVAFPAQALADAALRDWRNDTPCPLRLIVGPSFEAGMISVYSGGTAEILEDGDFRKSPWITPEDLARLGAIYVSTDPALLPLKGVSVIDSFDVSTASKGGSERLYWAIVPPATCDDDLRTARRR